MGGRTSASTSESPPPPPRSQSALEPGTDKQAGASPSIRSKYLTRIGVGETGAAMQRYQGLTVSDFKVPQWLQGYRPAVAAEERKEGEVEESLASNDAYSLSFVQPKSADEIRWNFFQRMSTMGIWVPQSQRAPNSNSSECHLVIIFDWDDTLLCTSFLNSREDAMNITSKAVKSQLKLLEEAVIRLLTVSTKLGNNYIITNAMKGWVEYSSSLWIPEVVPLLQNFTVISARHEYEQKFPGDFHQWKLQAFLEMTKLFDVGTVTNLICLGDSNIEMDAAHTLVQCYQNACIKTVKFRDCPNPDELVKQLDLVYEKFEKICLSGKNMTIRLER